jgi:hypothetical protein
MDPETFLVEWSVLADALCKTPLPPAAPRPGPAPALDRREGLTLAILGQWARFGSERDFWRYVQTRLRPYCPHLPRRPPCTRHLRRQQAALSAFALWLATQVGAGSAPDEAMDGTAVPTRTVKRRGRGWLPGVADLGKCVRRGWMTGVRLVVCTTPEGTVTGWGVGPASTGERALAATLLAHRAPPHPALASAGAVDSSVSRADGGFAGVTDEAHVQHERHAPLVAPPQLGSHRHWSRAERRWLAGPRHIVETVIGRLEGVFRLERERPHALGGFLARLAAKMALHNVCLWRNRQRGQPLLTLAALFGW